MRQKKKLEVKQNFKKIYIMSYKIKRIKMIVKNAYIEDNRLIIYNGRLIQKYRWYN